MPLAKTMIFLCFFADVLFYQSSKAMRSIQVLVRYEEYGTVVPFVLLAPAYFTGALDLGKLMQHLGMPL